MTEQRITVGQVWRMDIGGQCEQDFTVMYAGIEIAVMRETVSGSDAPWKPERVRSVMQLLSEPERPLQVGDIFIGIDDEDGGLDWEGNPYRASRHRIASVTAVHLVSTAYGDKYGSWCYAEELTKEYKRVDA